MARVPKHRIVAALLDRHGRTFAAEARIDLRRNTPAPLFRLLCLSLLLSARIRADIGVGAARALAGAGWTTPRKLADSTWAERTKVLDESGYARYDESTSRMLGETTELLLDRYGGDLRELRETAGRDLGEEQRLLQQFTGIGRVGAAIFCREVQIVWDEVYPFADDRALAVAADLGLGSDVADLRRNTADAAELARLVAALVRCGLAGDQDEILDGSAP